MKSQYVLIQYFKILNNITKINCYSTVYITYKIYVGNFNKIKEVINNPIFNYPVINIVYYSGVLWLYYSFLWNVDY